MLHIQLVWTKRVASIKSTRLIFFFCLPKHYGPGESYNSFVAKDISRAFVTGEFDPKSSKDSLDHVLSLSPSELVGLKKWRDFYAENYEFVGRLVGR